ncbi:hypothetical protein RO3G_10906 [Lichtheimia corymbifera JMRC:FSU:9682]|uniref:Pre-rRNA-processing protein RIX1 n=1 Tax=Lichtheimia corymbifera JMRC:FSU:9682 TaxID=1263082 RepID=A0A068S8Q5_9FUNG|nr:hypothetical protein RO3G_10906 [Lichtheimia corymbifera JMRC:FSU:9682]
MAALQLNRLLSDYLSDESSVHVNVPFITETIINNDLLNDQQKDDHSDLGAVKRKWTVRLNALLQSRQPLARWAAISLVKLTCEQSSSLYTANAQTWCAQCLGFLARPEQPTVHDIVIKTLSLIFVKSVGKPDLLTEVTNKNLSRFHQLLVTLASRPDHQFQTTALNALTIDMELFPSTTRHVMDKITKSCIIPYLEGSIHIDSELVGRYLVASTRSGGKANIATQWNEMLLKLVDTTHQALDRLFDTIDEEDSASFSRTPGYQLFALSVDYTMSFPVLLQRVQTLMNVVSACLTTKTESTVAVPFARIIQLVCRVYNVFPGCAMREFKPKDEHTCLMGLLPALYLSTNKVLSSLLYCADAGMTQYGKLLSSILLRLLSESKNKRSLRISVYELLSLCLEQYGHAFAANISKAAVQCVCDDLKIPERKPVSIISNVKAGKKRAADQQTGAVIDGEEAQSVPGDVQLAALDAAEQLMVCYGHAMGEAQRRALDTAIISRLLQPSNAETTIIKGKLYDYVIASVMNPNPAQASILPYAVRIFTAGVNAETHELRAICKRGLAICDLCVHTRLPPIQRAVSAPAAPAIQTQVVEEVVQQNDFEMTRDLSPSSSPTPPVESPATKEIPVQRPKSPPRQPSSSSPASSFAPIVPTMVATDTEPIQKDTFKPSESMARAMSDVIEEAQVIETVVTTTVDSKDTEMLSRQPTENSFTTTIDRQDSATPTTAFTTINDNDDNEDDEGSFDIPDIDMAGPDDDEDEE